MKNKLSLLFFGSSLIFQTAISSRTEQAQLVEASSQASNGSKDTSAKQALISENGIKQMPPQFSSQEIPADIAQLMTGLSWKQECPVPLQNLRYLTIPHWGYDNDIHTGHMVVHAKLAQEVLDIFTELFECKFPIERMELIDLYGADDDKSMEANNSSAFCCRANTTFPGTFSNHSYGIAIDINPLVNPYVKGQRVLPEAGRAYLDRTQPVIGIITESLDNPCYRAFISRGYEWGGNCWPDRIDYQHFSKKISDVVDDKV